MKDKSFPQFKSGFLARIRGDAALVKTTIRQNSEESSAETRQRVRRNRENNKAISGSVREVPGDLLVEKGRNVFSTRVI